MKLTEDYVKHYAVGVIELKCNRPVVGLVDENGNGISTYVVKGATIKAQKDTDNRLYTLLESNGMFRAYGYIDKEDYDAFEVLNPRLKINRERFIALTDALSDANIEELVHKNSTLLDCSDNCPLKTYCEIHYDNTKTCSDIVIDWLMENE